MAETAKKVLKLFLGALFLGTGTKLVKDSLNRG